MSQPLLTENITINAVLPAFVITNLAPGPLNSIWPTEHTTPMSTILKAFNKYLDTDKTGQIGECSLEEVYFRTQPEYANASQKWLVEDSGSLWEKAYPPPAK
jgi:15-hydroxyprostaglandin dehydrogenase (NAD)